jgi:hypothetical protein
MKKLFALLVVAGMVFVSCGGSQVNEGVEAEAQPVVEEQANVEEQPAADMQEENQVEATEVEEAPAEVPAE